MPGMVFSEWRLKIPAGDKAHGVAKKVLVCGISVYVMIASRMYKMLVNESPRGCFNYRTIQFALSIFLLFFSSLTCSIHIDQISRIALILLYTPSRPL
jgi:hypothetical protein